VFEVGAALEEEAEVHLDAEVAEFGGSLGEI